MTPSEYERECRALRREIRDECERIRRRVLDAPLNQVIAEVRGLRGLGYEPDEPSEAGGPRVVHVWQGNSSFGAIRRIVVPEPVKRDRWGGPIR